MMVFLVLPPGFLETPAGTWEKRGRIMATLSVVANALAGSRYAGGRRHRPCGRRWAGGAAAHGLRFSNHTRCPPPLARVPPNPARCWTASRQQHAAGSGLSFAAPGSLIGMVFPRANGFRGHPAMPEIVAQGRVQRAQPDRSGPQLVLSLSKKKTAKGSSEERQHHPGLQLTNISCRR